MHQRRLKRPGGAALRGLARTALPPALRFPWRHLTPWCLHGGADAPPTQAATVFAKRALQSGRCWGYQCGTTWRRAAPLAADAIWTSRADIRSTGRSGCLGGVISLGSPSVPQAVAADVGISQKLRRVKAYRHGRSDSAGVWNGVRWPNWQAPPVLCIGGA